MSIWDWILAAWALGEFDHHEEYIDEDELDNERCNDCGCDRDDYFDDDHDDYIS